MTDRMTYDSGELAVPGEFSTPRQIRGALERLRSEAEASFAILTVFELPNPWFRGEASTAQSGQAVSDGRTSELKARKLFRSLLFAAHERSRERKKLQASLLRVRSSSSIAVPPRSYAWSPRSIEKLLTHEPFTCLTRYRIEHGLHLLGFGSSTPADSVHPLKIGVILGVSPNTRFGGSAIKERLKQLNDLVRNSEAVAVNRSMTMADTIDRVLRRCEGHVKSLPEEAFAEVPSAELRELGELSRLAIAVAATALILTKSEVGDIFLTAKDPGNLYLTASCLARSVNSQARTHDNAPELRAMKMTSPLVLSYSAPDRDAGVQGHGNMKSVVQHVHGSSRPLVINGIPDFTEMHETVRYSRPAEISVSARIADLKELAVPIAVAGALAKDDPAIFGVLNLEKRQGRYGGSDLFVARHLAQYFCLQRAQVLGKAATSIIARVATDEMSTPVLSAESVLSCCRLQGRTLHVQEEVPVEFSLVHDLVESALEALYVATRSFHITVRLANTSGKRLCRFAEWPNGKGGDDLKEISTGSEASVNAWVFRNGRPCDLKNINLTTELAKYPGLQAVIKTWQRSPLDPLSSAPKEHCKSEYCIPIIVRSRVVGTLDLESIFVSAYSGQEQLIGMVAEQVVYALAKAQHSFENQLFMMLATARFSSHEILKIVDALRNSPNSERCRGLADRLSEIISQMSLIKFNSPTGRHQSLDEIISSVQGQGSTFTELVRRDPEGLLDLQLGEDFAVSLGLILKALILNASSAVKLTPLGTIRVIPRRIERSGRQYLSITISNPLQLRQFPDTQTKQAMFRVPFATDRWHLGTFMAGVLARSLGGDVRAHFTERRKNVQVVVEIPFYAAS